MTLEDSIHAGATVGPTDGETGAAHGKAWVGFGARGGARQRAASAGAPDASGVGRREHEGGRRARGPCRDGPIRLGAPEPPKAGNQVGVLRLVVPLADADAEVLEQQHGLAGENRKNATNFPEGDLSHKTFISVTCGNYTTVSRV